MNDDLEARLRDHYQRAAEEIHADPALIRRAQAAAPRDRPSFWRRWSMPALAAGAVAACATIAALMWSAPDPPRPVDPAGDTGTVSPSQTTRPPSPTPVVRPSTPAPSRPGPHQPTPKPTAGKPTGKRSPTPERPRPTGTPTHPDQGHNGPPTVIPTWGGKPRGGT